MDSDVVAYIGGGIEPCHIRLADGKGVHKPNDVVIDYGDEELHISTERMWRVLKELFEGER